MRNDNDSNLPSVQSEARTSPAAPIIIRPVRRKLVAYLPMSIVMTLNGVWLVSLDVWSLVAWLSIALFSAVTIMTARQVLDPRATVTIDGTGLFDRANNLGLIEWNDITGAVVEGSKGFSSIRLQLRDPEKYRSRLNFWTRSLWALNGRRDCVWIGLAGTTADAKQVVEVIETEVAARWLARATSTP